MINKIGFALGSISLLVDIAESCKNVEVISFANDNMLTDYLTTEDEITMQFGVGELLRF